MNTVVAGILLLTAFALLLDWAVGWRENASWSGSRGPSKPERT